MSREATEYQGHKETILVVDDDPVILKSAERILKPYGYEVEIYTSPHDAVKRCSEKNFDLVLSDLRMPEIDGLELLKKIKSRSPSTEVIIITGFGTVKTAVEALKYGAYDYIEKPFTPEHLLRTVSQCLDGKRLLIENLRLKKEVQRLYKLENIIGVSQAMQKVFELIAQVAPTHSTVLITGESGTGKELVARAIHYNSPRRNNPFTVVDCSMIPETMIEDELFGHIKGAFTGAVDTRKGLIEATNTGTLFFDEISNINLHVQAKLLRLIQEKEFRPLGSRNVVRVDVRFIAATNRDLLQLVREGKFREDFFYRLNVFPIKIPPLRERKEDIPLLADHFLKKYSVELGRPVRYINAEAMRILTAYDWPGNVRELENVIQRAVIVSSTDSIRPQDIEIPSRECIEIKTPRNAKELKEIKKILKTKAIAEIEKEFIIDALRRNNYNITNAAKEVGMQRTNFHALIRKYRIQIPGRI